MFGKIYSYIRSQSAKFKTNLEVFELLNQSIPILMGIFIFLNPFPHITSVKEICLSLSILIVLLLIIIKKVEFSFKTPLTLPLGLFVFWSFLSIFFALDKQNSLHDFRAHLLEHIILFYILINFFRSKKRLVALSWVIIVSATIFSIGGLFYYYHILGNKLSTRFALSFIQTPTNLIGLIIVFAIILSLHHFLTEIYLYRKSLLIICLVPLFAVTFLTQTRGTLIAMALAFAILLIKNKKTFIALFFALSIIVAVTPIKKRFTKSSGSMRTISHRTSLTYISLEIIKDYPIIGTGFGIQTFGNHKLIDPEVYNKRIPSKYRVTEVAINWPHNMLLSVAVRLGFVGLALFLYMLYVFVKIGLKTSKYGKDNFIKDWALCIASAFSAFFVIGMFEPVFTHLTEVMFFTILSMMTILWHLNEKTDGPRP